MSNPSFVLDPITGFLDRSGGLSVVRRVIAETDAGHRLSAVLWLDLDRFRKVNESFGHRGGDRVIKRVAGRIRAATPKDAFLLRMGSDEFVVVLAGTDRSSAAGIGRTLAVELARPMRHDDMVIHPTASIGLAFHEPGEDPLALLERADRAMLDAKRQGGNRLVVSGDETYRGLLDGRLARDELLIENDLHLALETGGLLLEYQPVVGFDGRIEAIEGLMRCQVQGRRLMPGRFIPVAEKTGMIVRLGEWSLMQAARFGAQLRVDDQPLKVAVNVSRAQLTSPGFLAALHGALLCANLDPALIELELTESLVMEESEIVQSNLRSIRAAGVGVAIDDFGTGYSCLSCLKDLHATKLKLDRSFVSVLPDDVRAFAVIKAVTQLARELGMVVVAEGVETIAQRDAVEAAGVDAIQGFLHAHPMSEIDLLDWLQTRRTP
jgi:diguanylate cyclase (GGDEF)-like protein